MKVTRLPHDGRMIMGGRGSLIPFNPSQPSSSGVKPQNTAPSGDMSNPEVASKNQDRVDQSLDELAKEQGLDR